MGGREGGDRFRKGERSVEQSEGLGRDSRFQLSLSPLTFFFFFFSFVRSYLALQSSVQFQFQFTSVRFFLSLFLLSLSPLSLF